MTKIVVDSNIIFSAILNFNSRIAQILMNNHNFYKFYSPQYSKFEIFKHQNKLKKLAGISDENFQELIDLCFKNITLLEHNILPTDAISKAKKYCSEIDKNDVYFVAFSDFLNAKLWTGDKKLISGLKKKNFKNTLTTTELFQDFMNKHGS